MSKGTHAPLLLVKDLHVSYGKVEAVHGVQLQAEQGQIVTVIGPNGAGKSTLLNALAGALPINGQVQGGISFMGESIADMPVARRVAQGISLVPEKRELFGSMSVQDNLVLGSYRRYRQRERNYADQLEPVYELFPRLRERRGQLAATLSGGERQMLAIGRALMAKPRLLMLDEPSLGLAPLIVREIFQIIRRLRETGVTILLVEQNARAALQVSDHAYVLETGDVMLSGPSSQLANDPKVIETYLGLARR
jgi:branched-chain amino acid transport system ATP-binding protein